MNSKKTNTKKPVNKAQNTKKRKKTGSVFQNMSEKIRNMENEQLITLCYILYGGFLLYLLYRYYRVLWWLDPILISNNPLIIVFCAGAPIFLWIFGTKYEKFSFHNRKKMLLHIACINAVLNIIQPIIYLSHQLIVKNIMNISPGENVTKGMILMQARVAVLIPLGISFALIYTPIRHFLTSTEMEAKIERFKITHHVDDRKNKDHQYDLKIVKDLKTGKVRVVKMMDRFVHMFINGASGTGKTSMTITRAIEDDLDKKVENMQYREELLLKMVKAGKCVVLPPVANITERHVKPRKPYIEGYKALYEKYPDCGITVMAPNNSMNKDVIRLAIARKQYVNVIDPDSTFNINSPYIRKKGIMPFYIPFDLPEDERAIDITNAAENFSEVMVAANETEQTGEQYFRDINTSVTSNIAIAVMLANNISRKQTSITEIQQCINEFEDLEPYIATIEDYFGISVKVMEIDSKGKDDISTLMNKNRAESDRSNGRDNPYYETIHFIKQELLGSGKEKMFDQARGLRNLINKLLRDPRIKNLLDVSEDRAINFEGILRNNEITVVNTAIEFSQQSSTAFGLFFMLNFAIAVKKRKENERSPHFLWIDEAAQYMHKMYDDMITLYRQYRVAVGLAMQSISQMEKSRSTAYLKNVILGAGTHIVFGRGSAEEMKLYSELGGLEDVDIIQKTVTATSLFSSNASQSGGERVQQDKINVMEASDIRLRDFQEVTVFTIDNGRVLFPYAGKLNFVKKESFLSKDVKRVNWAKYVLKKKQEAVLKKPANEIVKEQKSIIAENKGNMTILEQNTEKPMTITPVDQIDEVSGLFSDAIFEDEVESTVIIDDIEDSGNEENLRNNQIVNQEDLKNLFISDDERKHDKDPLANLRNGGNS